MEKLAHLTNLEKLPLSSNQKRLWIISQQNKLDPSYNLQQTYHLQGTINIEVFKESLNLLFERQHTMFSVFKQHDEVPYISIITRPVIVDSVDFSCSPSDTVREEILSFAGDKSRIPFNIEKGPLYRLYLLKESEQSYFFCFTVHHLIFDGFSRGLFIQELSTIYNSLLKGTIETIEPLKFHSYDFATLEKEELSPENKKDRVEYWKENLKACPPELNFPYDFPRCNNRTGLGCMVPFQISRESSQKLRALGRASNSSVFKTSLSILGILLNKYTGVNDICIGIPVSNRRSLDYSYSSRVFGFFVDTLPLRLLINEENNFRKHIDYSTEVFNKCVQYSLPFDKIVEILNPERIPGLSPFFQICLSWFNNFSAPLNLEGVAGNWITLPKGISPFDITFYMYENGDFIEGEIEYNIDLIKYETIIRLRDNLLILADNLLENPDASIDSIQMISNEEKEMIRISNDTSKSYSKDKTIIDLFEERAALSPERIAIVFDEGELGYSELNAKAAQLAGVLQSYKIGPGDFIGLLLNRSPELIICLLAILKTGAAYVPLNLTDPGNRIMSIIKVSGIKFVITNLNNDIKLEEISKRLNIEELTVPSGTSQILFKKILFTSNDPAYIIFTSGTTGVPKGVLVNHKSVINTIEWVNNTFNVSSSDKLLWTTNLSFDLSVYDIFGILAAGGIIRILSNDDRQDPEKQYALLLKEKITFWDSAPQSLQQLTPFFNRNDNSILYNSLRLVFLSGDWIPLSLPETVTSNFPKAVVVSLGGATEATIWSNYYIIEKIRPEWKSIPYGKPIQNAKYYILDDKMSHCRIQQPGNLYIGGECLALGYYNDTILTSSKFISDPFNKGDKLYITGDKAQWMADGNIEFLGRDDEQVKVRGYRVELGEIKNVALQNKAIKEAIAVPEKSDRHNIKVILFITTFNDTKIDAKDLKREFRACLPEYMIPSDIIRYAEFPLTVNGKTDTKKMLSDYIKSLTDSQNKKKSKSTEELKTITPTERRIYKIWSEGLQYSDISLTDSFFDIGGNSLLAISLINKIKEHTGFELSFKEFLSNPTIIQLGAYIDSQHNIQTKTIELIHLTEMVNLPLTRNQRRLWLISKMNPDISSYIIPFTFKLSGTLNHNIFQQSLETLFNRHHILFSVIKEINGEPYCDIVRSKVDISFIDYSGLSEETKLDEIYKLIDVDSRKVFDLNKGPLFRLYLIMTAPEEYYFHLSIHHLVFDGWSWSVFVNDLSKIYNSLLRGIEIDLEEIEFQEYDYAHWEKISEGSEDEKKSMEFWEENLTGASPLLNFPYDFQRKENPSGRGSHESIRLSKNMSEKLKRISLAEGSSLFTTLFSVFGIQMHKYSGEDDLNIGLPVAYRPHSKLENIVGMFVNTIVVRLKYAKGLTFKNILRRTSEATLNAITHQNLTFDKVVEIVNPKRSSNVNPLFQVAFAWQNHLAKPIKLDGIRSEGIEGTDRAAEFDITLGLWENDDVIEGTIEYNIDILKRETIIRLRDNFITLIENLLESSDSPVESVPMISDRERTMIDGFNNTRTDYPKDKTIIQLFEDQVNLYPLKTAVVFKDSSLTYSQLNEKANQLSRRLRDMGVEANIPVALLADKSLDLFVGIIGILKAGGCYTPLDSGYPLLRIGFILKDSGCKILLTQDKFMDMCLEGITKLNLSDPDIYTRELSNPTSINKSTDLAYILYTSGTTGIPKGTPIPQQGVVRLVRNTNYINITPEDCVLQAGAIVFDASTFEIWGALLNGGKLCVVDKDTLLNPGILGNVMAENNISIVLLTSSFFTQIAESHTHIFYKVKSLLVGGDILSATHINKVRKKNPQLTVINVYGPTENSCISTTYRIDRDFNNNIPIGKPISNSPAYILDNYLNNQPIGIVGELYVGGDGLSKGYLNREDLNKACFIDNPYKPGERLYKTGDRARWLHDGNIEFHGRIDNQLKIRGFRVELDEIESVISEIDEVIETVIKPVKIQEGDYKLIAFLNVPVTYNMDEDEIRMKVKERLPAYMVPSAYIFMNGFPKTINGKIDRKALSYNESEFEIRERNENRGLSPTEKIVLNIWCDSLKAKDILSTDNFFNIGGNSLLAINVFSKIMSEFKLDLDLRIFFDSPCVKDLAETIDITLNKEMKKKSLSNKEASGSQIISGEI